MDLSLSMTALKNVFRFPFRDPRWQNKFLIGSGLMFAGFIIPLLPLLPVLGYYARLVRAGAANENAEQLPAWDDWGELFVDGLRLGGAGLLLSLPGMIVMFAGWLVYMLTVFSMSSLSARGDSSAGWAFLGAFGFFFLCLGVGMLLLIVSSVLMPPAEAHVAVTRRFGAFFDVGAWWRVLRRNFSGFLIALGVFFMLYLVIMLAWQLLYFTIILCAFAPLILAPLTFYACVVLFRLIGQAYGEAVGEKPVPPAGQPV